MRLHLILLLTLLSLGTASEVGTLIIDASNEKSKVIVNGDTVGTGKVTVSLPVGEHEISVRRKWYRRDRLVTVKASEEKKIRPKAAIFDLKLATFTVSNFRHSPTIGLSASLAMEPIYNRLRLSGELGFSWMPESGGGAFYPDQIHVVCRTDLLLPQWGMVLMAVGGHVGFPDGYGQIGPSVSMTIGDYRKIVTGRIAYDPGFGAIGNNEIGFSQVLWAGVVFDI